MTPASRLGNCCCGGGMFRQAGKCPPPLLSIPDAHPCASPLECEIARVCQSEQVEGRGFEGFSAPRHRKQAGRDRKWKEKFLECAERQSRRFSVTPPPDRLIPLPLMEIPSGSERRVGVCSYWSLDIFLVKSFLKGRRKIHIGCLREGRLKKIRTIRTTNREPRLP